MSKQKNGSGTGSGKVLLYKGKNGEVELRVDSKNDTLWATENQIADLFETTQQNINLHINNVYAEGELMKPATHKESLLVQKEGGREVSRLMDLYDLDVIIAVGYRVNSKKATAFRIWATGILREYVLEGYSLNEHKLTKESNRIEDVYDALDYLEDPKHDGKLKGKLTLRISRDLI